MTIVYSIIALFIVIIVGVTIDRLVEENKRKKYYYSPKYRMEQDAKKYREKTIAYYRMNRITFCPNCLGTNIEAISSSSVTTLQPMLKTTYTPNLNPFKPLKFVNKNQTIVMQGSSMPQSIQWRCRNCLKQFYT